MLILLLLAADDQLFTQASSLRLRAEANAKAKVVRELPIGTACTKKGVSGEWTQVDCQGAIGFAKTDMLAAQAPDLSKLQEQMRAGTTKDRLNAAGRVLALVSLRRDEMASENLYEAREQYRALFYDAELDRLAESRKKGDTLKTPKTVADLADAHNVLAEWTHLHKKGDDFVYAALLADNDIYVASGKGQYTIELTYKSPIDQAAVQALTERETVNGCYAPMAIDKSGGCEYQFDQNCAPDKCWDPFQTCKQAAANVCLGCAQTCTTTCLDCRRACKTQDCLLKCGDVAQTCGGKCAGGKKKETATCDASYKSCSDKEDRWYKKNCEAACKKCNGNYECKTIKEECKERCFPG